MAVVDGGSPFTPAPKHVASDGSFKDGGAGVLATGYTIVNAESMDKALGHAKGCPVLDSGGQVTVYETIDMGSQPAVNLIEKRPRFSGAVSS